MPDAVSAQPQTRFLPNHDPEAEARLALYRLLAALLREPPKEPLIRQLVQYENPDRNDGQSNEAWQLLGLAARTSDSTQIDDEFHELFIGLGRGELVPYGSWYQTGYLMEQPLSRLRDDLSSLGFERRENHREPEDHVAALMEVVSLLIEEEEPLEVQADFFCNHLEPWVLRFFDDLEQARSAVFYRAVARLGRQFLELEQQSLTSL